MTALLCRVFGHRWSVFNAEQCPVEYRVCERCLAVLHACNTAFRGAAS